MEKQDDKVTSTASNSTKSDTNKNKGSSDTTSTKKQNTGKNTSSSTNKKPSSSSSNNNNSSNSSSSTSNTQHNHNWTAVYENVYHEAVWDTVWVVDKAAYTEEVTVYEWQSYPICYTCQVEITENVSAHVKAHALKGEPAGHKEGWRQVPIGTETVTHPEEGHYEYKLIKEAYTEKKLVGYKCSCGATK